jgi:hypothetical protein
MDLGKGPDRSLMANIFISYSSVDRSAVEDLARDLQRLGHAVWLDRALHVGQDWWDAILSELRGCDMILYAISATSLESEACRRELQYGRDLKRQVVPIIVASGVNLKLLPASLQRLHCVDFSSDAREGLLSLIESLQSIPTGVALPDPLPEPPAAPLSQLSQLAERLRSSSLSEEEQALILYKLKKLGSRQDSLAEVRELMGRLLGHPSLLASIKEEAETWLSQGQTAGPAVSEPEQGTNAAAGTATVYILREAMLWNSIASSFRVVVDGKPMASLKNGEDVTLTLPVGQHRLQIKTGLDVALLGGKSQQFVLNLAAGEEVRLRCSPSKMRSLSSKIQLVREP